MDHDKLIAQFNYLSMLKGLREGKLRKMHREVFRYTKWWIKIPKWIHRSLFERRLFYWFCAKNYHYPKEHPFTREFRRKASHILSREYAKNTDPEEDARQRLRDLANFSKANIKALEIAEVDRYLASLGLFIEADEPVRRKVLWEWFNRPASELVKHQNRKGKFVRAIRRGTANNGFYLRDLILQHPTIDFEEFRDRFGDKMPTVTRNSYNVARCLLRKAGYQIPKLHSGTRNPVLKRGVYGHLTMARSLLDTEIDTNG